MPNIVSNLISPTDKDIITGFKKIWDKLGEPENCTYNIRLGDRDPIQLTGNLSEILEDKKVAKLNSAGSSIIHTASLNLSSIGLGLSIKRNDPYDLISVNPKKDDDSEQTIEAITTVRNVFKKFEITSGSLRKVLGSELADFYSSREGALARLESLAEDLISQTHEYRQTLDEKAEKERLRLREEFDKEKKELLNEIKEKEALIEKRESELDDRSNTHARRKLREDLKNILKQRNTSFNLTSETQKKRKPIHILFSVLILVLLGVTFYNVYLSSSDPTYWINIKTSIGILSLAGAIGFYIKWADNWARQHADEEFKLRQLELDVDRASWLVEMALEWKEERGTEIPKELVDRLSRGLFVKGSTKGDLQHPAQNLASSLLGASAALKIDVPGLGQLQLDRKGLNRFQKAIDEEAEKKES